MIQNYGQIQSVLKEINQHCLNSSSGKIQKIYSTTRYICLSTRFRGITIFLYLGRGKRPEGIWIGDALPDAKIRVQDAYLQYLRKHLLGGAILGIHIDELDRIIKFEMIHEGIRKAFYFFWAGRNLYFANSIKKEDDPQCSLFCSWNGESREQAKDFNIFDEVGRKKLTGRPEGQLKDIESIASLLQKERDELLSKDKKPKLSGLEKKKLKVEEEILNLTMWENLGSSLKEETFSLDGKDYFSLGGIKVKFAKEWNHYKKVDKIYQKWKNIKKAILIQKERLSKIEKELVELPKVKVISNERKKELLIRPVFKQSKLDIKLEGEEPQSDVAKHNESRPFEIYIYQNEIHSSSCHVGFGKNAKSNDLLRNQWASKNDMWFHIHGYKSAHAIAKADQIDQDMVAAIGSALRDFSGLSLTLIPILYTQVKNLKGVKGEAGKVSYKKQKEVSVFYNENWKSLLLLQK